MDDLRLSNVGYVYQDGISALEEFSFAIEKGERVSIVGPNGAGKRRSAGRSSRRRTPLS